MSGPSPTVVFADDHVLFREALTALLEIDGFTVLAEASDGDAALELVTEHEPDLALLDVQMPGPGPEELVRRVRSTTPETKIVILSMHAPSDLVSDLADLGIAGYFVKSIGRRSLVAGLFAALASTDMISLIPRPVDVSKAAALELSPRETEVLRLMAKSYSNRQIADELFISEATVKRHITTIYGRLGVVSRVAALSKAFREGLIGGLG